MSEVELTLEKKREKALAAMECIADILKTQKAETLVNAKKNQEKLAEIYKAEKRASWLGFGVKLVLNILARVFLKVDSAFLNYRKDSPDPALKELLKKDFAEEVERDFTDTFELLESITAKVRRLDSAAELCYEKMCGVAADHANAATALLDMAEKMELFIRVRPRELLNSLQSKGNVLEIIRDGVNGVLYPAA